MKDTSAMKCRYYVNPYKFACGLATSVFCAIIGTVQALRHDPISALVFFLIALVFLYTVFLSASIIILDEDGVSCSFLGFSRRCLSWSDIAEVGVLGTKVFNRSNPNKTGEMYIYFSTKPLTDDECFRLGLKWPPHDMIYLLYTKERLQQVQLRWSSFIRTYNTGKLHIE